MISIKPTKSSESGAQWVVLFVFISLVGIGFTETAFAGEDKGICPQPRKTKSAPTNLANTGIPDSASVEAGKAIYEKTAKPMACKMCHGDEGNGNGKLGKALKPHPRNFTCADTMKNVSPGQMFWIIKNGSKGTGMVAHGKTLSDKQIWDVVKYIDTQFVKR
ncbi:MAG: c-type cytochrome [Nitrospinota bacterium]|nr:c-type cytochrome [Nitrospinota bacterium]